MENIIQTIVTSVLSGGAAGAVLNYFGKALIEKTIKTETEKAIRRFDRYHGRIADAVEDLNSQVVDLEEAMARLCDQNNDEPTYRTASLEVSKRMYQFHRTWRLHSRLLSEETGAMFRALQGAERDYQSRAFSIIVTMQRPGDDIDSLIERKIDLQMRFESEFVHEVETFQSGLIKDLK
jgi:hypothetical protein